MSRLREVRDKCRKKSRLLLEGREICHLNPRPHSDGCGYFEGKYCYLRVDCRTVRSKPLCWITIIDHYSGEILVSRACETTPEAARFGRGFFTKKGRLPK